MRSSRSSSHSPSSQRQRQPIHFETNHGLPVLPRQPSLVPRPSLACSAFLGPLSRPLLALLLHSLAAPPPLGSVRLSVVRCGGRRERRRSTAAVRSSTLSILPRPPRPTAALKRSGRCEGGLSPLPPFSEYVVAGPPAAPPSSPTSPSLSLSERSNRRTLKTLTCNLCDARLPPGAPLNDEVGRAQHVHEGL